MISVKELDAGYGDIQVLRGVSLEINEGEIVSLVGANAAGKSTMVKALSGIIKPWRGQVLFDGVRVDTLEPHEIVELGIVQVPEGRRLFPQMSVLENLLLGAYTPRARRDYEKTLRDIFEMFPILKERQNQLAGSLSGGEQQMCAIGRGLMAKPKLLMLDEPSLGLAPILVAQVLNMVKAIREQGVTVLLVEQNVRQSLALADRGYVLENGRIVMEGPSAALLADDRLRQAYLGM
ncbi:MAG TPA: ABC transporter ATP-binding protein [Thermosynergistes sp.]|nr:ABC transporter ATP-binding protein [Thermosynergistes sp.]HOK19099.1 ABC transporter ATP-binding protein [Thermosynergistes sp.]HPU78599.1 ABC transporter ATP-binding protein [Thermosynergistes sp.]HPZ77120.1 ABC transporter ATP-binding protein [Thermosynergistes sp.]HXK90154.1 ABC transporter ATP-binding protein [Thermosynergistes sp.]